MNIKTSNFTAVPGETYGVDTTAGDVQIHVPAGDVSFMYVMVAGTGAVILTYAPDAPDGAIIRVTKTAHEVTPKEYHA